MRLSQFFINTLKEEPIEAELVSHRLMIRSGMIRQLAQGLYTWLPLGLRVLRKVERIVREEMDAIGALELLMPTVHPAGLWQESGRWQAYGAELLRFKDRHQRDFCYAPTHEEVIAAVMRNELKSYKQLPALFYQIQTKFRDEIRPRFGVMRGREFLMKDAYSFHMNQASLQDTYDKMHQAYTNIFTRLGLVFRPVIADTGSIGGQRSHEFQALASSGEDCVVYSNVSDYAANIELAEAAPSHVGQPTAMAAIEKFATPGVDTIAALTEHYAISADAGVKTLVFQGEKDPLVALVLRGDHQLNLVKAGRLPELAKPLTMAEPEDIKEALGASIGSLGVVDLKIPYVVDRAAEQMSNFVCGANQDGFHYRNVNWGRDAELKQVADIRNVLEGDCSPDGKGHLVFTRGIELGQIFQLGALYTRAMQTAVLNQSGKSVYPLMGCYGIGISRVVAAFIEQHHDENGMIWSDAIAPFTVILIPINGHKHYRVREVADRLYQALREAGVDVLLDDRKERPGVKFSDADLLGVPHRIVVGERDVDAGLVEYKARAGHEVQKWVIESTEKNIQSVLNSP